MKNIGLAYNKKGNGWIWAWWGTRTEAKGFLQLSAIIRAGSPENCTGVTDVWLFSSVLGYVLACRYLKLWTRIVQMFQSWNLSIKKEWQAAGDITLLHWGDMTLLHWYEKLVCFNVLDSCKLSCRYWRAYFFFPIFAKYFILIMLFLLIPQSGSVPVLICAINSF